MRSSKLEIKKISYSINNNLILDNLNLDILPEEIINKGLIRTLPYMYNGGMDGFFVARIKKLKN